ncbi:MAG: hypothetical protein IT445_16955 [Phycisphaeraceae bacterium]|nr:hypothetical protein [Phycisphaeraceae bacterium]
MNCSRCNFGSAMTETVLSLPLILLILALLIFFGQNMQRLQRVAVVDRYEAWRQIVDAPGPKTDNALNTVFFGGNAPSLKVYPTVGYFTDTQDFLVSEAQLTSDQASAWMATMFDELPGSISMQAKATFEQPVKALSKFTGPIIHHHTVLDGDWRYAPWAEWRQEVDRTLPVVDFWPALRDEFIMTLEDRLEPLASSGNDLATTLRRCYLNPVAYRGPGDENYWPQK